MKPINEWIIVEDVEDDEKTESGIILTAVKKNSVMKKSKVIAISPDVARYCQEEKYDLQYGVGSIVFRHKQTGIPVAAENNKKFFIKYDGIMAVE